MLARGLEFWVCLQGSWAMYGAKQTVIGHYGGIIYMLVNDAG